MQQELTQIRQEALQKIAEAKTTEELRKVEIEFLGRKQGKLALLLRDLSGLSEEERPKIGKLGNEAKNEIAQAIEEKEASFSTSEKENEFYDVTLSGIPQRTGRHHPLSRFIREVEDVFGRLGFETVEGPEVDDDWHNFGALNFTEHHPAREMQDTFFVGNLVNHVLRTQTSNVQIHYMEGKEPPFRVIAPGKVFRKDSDATHSPMFHQVEGLMIDRDVSISHLKFVLLSALRELISSDLELRFRTSYFPFTEPSLEVDASCPICSGKSPECRVCKGTGWLEIGGAGMVHPNVLRNVGVNPEEWNGFAFGFGIERQVMIRHSIPEIRSFFENDLRFLEQF
ncbi:phenylalanine--tRNA ligase subunit alpha [Candidatus Peregrinibacteria bacterium]|nr:MAG: phenylalanine--tRNA ligase subunit alpha [Candidatus Peregrinibacteria bacterium]